MTAPFPIVEASPTVPCPQCGGHGEIVDPGVDTPAGPAEASVMFCEWDGPENGGCNGTGLDTTLLTAEQPTKAAGQPTKGQVPLVAGDRITLQRSSRLLEIIDDRVAHLPRRLTEYGMGNRNALLELRDDALALAAGPVGVLIEAPWKCPDRPCLDCTLAMKANDCTHRVDVPIWVCRVTWEDQMDRPRKATR